MGSVIKCKLPTQKVSISQQLLFSGNEIQIPLLYKNTTWAEETAQLLKYVLCKCRDPS